MEGSASRAHPFSVLNHLQVPLTIGSLSMTGVRARRHPTPRRSGEITSAWHDATHRRREVNLIIVCTRATELMCLSSVTLTSADEIERVRTATSSVHLARVAAPACYTCTMLEPTYK